MKKFLSKALWGLYISAALTVAGICGAAAYIDPSVVSFAASAIGGILIAAGAVLFVWWRKVKLKVSTKLGIDENAKKEKEEDLVINGEDSAQGAASCAASCAAASAAKGAAQGAAQNPEQSTPADEPAVRQ